MHWTSLYLSLEAIDLPNTGIFFDPRSRRRKNWNRTTRSTRPIERKGYLILVIEGLSPREILETRRKIGIELVEKAAGAPRERSLSPDSATRNLPLKIATLH